MFKKSLTRVFAPLMVGALVFSLALAGCGGGDAPDPSQGGEEPAVEQEASQEELSEEPAADVSVYVHKDADAASDTLVSLPENYTWAVIDGRATEDVAAALESGAATISIVPLNVAAILYNEYECPCMALDAYFEAGMPQPLVSIVGMKAFAANPEAYVGYVSAHLGGAVNVGGYDEGAFTRGSAMQDLLSSALSDLYVADPDSVGGDLLPDNFYFLG